MFFPRDFSLADIKPSVVIVEEAAEILEGQLVAVIPPSVQHLIMIGDHKQLKPMVHYHRLKKHHHLDLSMFERLWNCRLPCKQLGFQCRMRDEFVDLLRELKIYDNLQTHKQVLLTAGILCPYMQTCMLGPLVFPTCGHFVGPIRKDSQKMTQNSFTMIRNESKSKAICKKPCYLKGHPAEHVLERENPLAALARI